MRRLIPAAAATTRAAMRAAAASSVSAGKVTATPASG